MNTSIFFVAGMLAAAIIPAQAKNAPGLFDDIVNGTPPPSTAFAGLPDPPTPIPSTADCFEFIEPTLLPLTPVLLNRCTGATWVLVRHPVADAQGHATSQVVYRWAPVLSDPGEAVFGGVGGPAAGVQ